MSEQKPGGSSVTMEQLREVVDLTLTFSIEISVANGMQARGDWNGAEKRLEKAAKTARKLNDFFGQEIITGLPDA